MFCSKDFSNSFQGCVRVHICLFLLCYNLDFSGDSLCLHLLKANKFYACSLQVLFVCTANVIEMIPNPLLDRMEVISIAGYITDEKMHIARDYLEKATREICGIKPEQVILLPYCSL